MKTVMTKTKLAQAVSQRLGKGRQESYQSWIRVRRNLSSPVSNLHRFQSAYLKRPVHLLSGLEFGAAHVALWIGARELREQHPAWPDPHPHPAGGMNPEFDRALGEVPGLLEIAKEAGIDHGVYPGTRIPFVATLDFTLGVGAWFENRIVHWSCKPRELLDTAPNRMRMKERIKLEELYSEAVGARRHVVIDGTQFNQALIEKLDFLMPLRSELMAMGASGRLEDFATEFMNVAGTDPIFIATQRAGDQLRLSERDAQAHFRAACWLGLIDIDLSQPIVMSRPLKRDARGFKDSLRKQLLETD